MAQLHVRHIKQAVLKDFNHLLAQDDLKNKSDSDKEDAILTRAQMAYVLSFISGCDNEQAANSITDGYLDNGIDSIFYSRVNQVLYFGQSKWRNNGNGSIDVGSVRKFLSGINKIINSNYSRVSDKIKEKQVEIEDALDNVNIKIVFLLCYTGNDKASDDVIEALDDFVENLNDSSDIFSYKIIKQQDIHNSVSAGKKKKIDLEVLLSHWGSVKNPYLSFYGQVAASDLAQWYKSHQENLFSPNIRMFLGSTEVNNSIISTLKSEPEKFWYFNNGITALCDKIVKKAIGGGTKEHGQFCCYGLTIVNGAQTVGSIASANQDIPEKVEHAKVPLRIISLESCPPQLEVEITKKNNTQNKIEKRDFVSLDSNQERLRVEMLMDDKEYKYKSGDVVSNPENQCGLEEATIARACAQSDISLVVDAKSGIGRLWDDIGKAPYTILFNKSLTGPQLWRLIQVYRYIEIRLTHLKKTIEGKERAISVHGNRFITHIVMQSATFDISNGSEKISHSEIEEIYKLCSFAVTTTHKKLNRKYPDSYVANVFKNQMKSADLKELVLKDIIKEMNKKKN
ncbi:AIPR family protein [Paramixta manurensis]|uniref:AIPR family protein n=1 Tax=Paramixta manurensis TaxID=2740817 RepID=A0A6M8UUB9_9GAMM|nr:AIPR family protein [Erwiniaceae bacterium PD-1]